MKRIGYLLASHALLSLTLLSPRASTACTVLPSLSARVLPSGSDPVSTSTSLTLVGPPGASVSLDAAGAPVALNPPVLLGGSAGGSVSLVSPVDLLLPGTTYTVSILPKPGAPPVVSTFTTASGYDKEPGSPPQIESLRLWRVRYPLSAIGAGGCVFDEYVGFLEVRWKSAVIPRTAPGETLHVFSLAPRHGVSRQSFVVIGADTQLGAEPVGASPSPLQSWNPELDPSREYCLSVRALGDGDLSRPASEGNVVCACVEQRSAEGAPPPPFENGCHSTGEAGAAGAAGAGGSGAGAGGDAGPGASQAASEGCGVTSLPSPRGWPWATLLLAALARLRRRR